MTDENNPTVNFILQLALLTMMAEPMLKYKKSKRVKTARPARFINPSENHTARVYPRQSIRVVLDFPQKLSNVSEEAHWEFTLSSPYFVLTNKFDNNKEQEVYEFSQIYDLTEWASISEIYLGEIRYCLVNNTNENGPEGGSLLVFMNPEGGGRPEVLTVINPEENIVKLEPSRILEVVLSEDWPRGHLDDWTVDIKYLSVDKEEIFLKEIARTWISPNFTNTIHAGFNVLPRYNPVVNKCIGEKLRNEITDELSVRPKPTREHHFWFQFDPESQKRCRSIKNGNCLVAKLTFTGSCFGTTNRIVRREILVLLSLHGKPERVVETISEGDMLAEASKRILDKNRCILTNPGVTDQIDFNSQTDSYTIEIVAPKYIWQDEPDVGRWEVEYDNDHLKDSYLNFVAIPPLNKNGIMFQRIRVKRKDLGNDREQNQKILGSIKISYPQKKHIPEAVRRISMWIVKDKPTPTRECRSIYNNTSASYVSTSGEHWKVNVGRYDRPKRSRVIIEEMPLASLEENAKTKKLSEIRPYISSSDDCYGEYYSNGFCGISKKNSTVSTIVLGNPSTSSRTLTSPTSTAVTDELFLFNPVHLQEIVLTQNQVLVLQLSQPEDMCANKEKCYGELWSVNSLQVGDAKPLIEKQTVSKLSSTKYRQEVRIKVNESNFPEAAGNFCAGAISMQSSGGNRLIRIRFMKGQSAVQTYTPPKMGKVLDNLVVHEAAGRKYEYAPQWHHDDCVLLDPDTTFYVVNPESNKDCADWSVCLIPHPIEPIIWEKLSPVLTNLIDRCRPWYKRDMPVHLNRTLYFKPLSLSCNVEVAKILKEIAQITKSSYYPVATLMYENTKKTLVNDPAIDGNVEQTVRYRKRLFLYVKLPEQEKQKILTFEPKHNEHIHARVGDEVVIRIKTIRDENIMKWTSKSYPSFLKEGTKPTGDNDWDIFQFTVLKQGSDYVYFYNPAGESYRIHITAI